MKIKNMRKVSLGKTVAFFSVEWEGHLTINDCKLVQGNNGVFAAMPSREYTDKQGQKKWQPVVWVEQELLVKISNAAQAEYSGPLETAPPIPF